MNEVGSYYLRAIFISVLLIGCIIRFVHGQEQELPLKTNLIELCYPVHHFFDHSDTRWWLYDGYGTIRYWHDPVIDLLLHSGIAYTRFNAKSHAGFQFSCRFFGDNYFTLQRFNEAPGDVLERQFFLISFQYLYPLISTNRLFLWGNAGLNYRLGWETIHISFGTGGEHLVEIHNLADLGPSIGLKLSKPLPWNFQIGTEAKYTRFLYRRDKGNPYYPFDKGASPNLLTVQLNVGYRF